MDIITPSRLLWMAGKSKKESKLTLSVRIYYDESFPVQGAVPFETDELHKKMNTDGCIAIAI